MFNILQLNRYFLKWNTNKNWNKITSIKNHNINSNKYPNIKFNYIIVTVFKGCVWVETSGNFDKNKNLFRSRCYCS